MTQFIINHGPQAEQSLEFIYESGSAPFHELDKRKVRSQAMRHYRKREKLAQAEDERRPQRGSKSAKRTVPLLQPRQEAAEEMQTDIISLTTPTMCSVYRMAANAVLLEGFFPGSLRKSERVNSRCQLWRMPRTKAVEAVHDSIYLLQMNCTRQNAQLAIEGQKRHLAAVSCLRGDLERSQPDLLPAIIAALFLLLSEVYEPIAKADDDWRWHVIGIVRLLELHGPSIVETSFGSVLFQTGRMFGLNYALLNRKGFSLDSDHWRGLHADQPGSPFALLDHAVCLPALLEETDFLSSKGRNNRPGLLDCLFRCQTLEQDLINWLEWRYESLGHEACPYRLIPMGEYAGVIAPTSNAPDQAYTFDSFLSAAHHSFYWCCLLLLRSSMMDITELLDPARTSEVRSSANVCATALQQSIPYILSSAEGNIALGTTIRLPLLFARQWFARTSCSAEVEWCDTLTSHALAATSGMRWDVLLPLSHLILALVM